MTTGSLPTPTTTQASPEVVKVGLLGMSEKNPNFETVFGKNTSGTMALGGISLDAIFGKTFMLCNNNAGKAKE